MQETHTQETHTQELSSGDHVTPAAILELQRTVGNRAVAMALENEPLENQPLENQPLRAEASGSPIQRSTVPDVLRSAGVPLDSATREEFETRLGADFTDVRLHTSTAAQRSAAEIGARAYTSGNHIVIGAGGGDKHTLAHELTHVIQQRNGPVDGAETGDGLKISHPSDRFEREAEAVAEQAMRGPVTAAQSVQRMVATGGDVAIQRMNGAALGPANPVDTLGSDAEPSTSGSGCGQAWVA